MLILSLSTYLYMWSLRKVVHYETMGVRKNDDYNGLNMTSVDEVSSYLSPERSLWQPDGKEFVFHWTI